MAKKAPAKRAAPKSKKAEPSKDGAKEPKSKKSKKGKAGEAAAEVAEEDADEADGQERPDPSVGAPLIVIHPGSTNLRIGLASTGVPRTLPHCVAYRRTEAGIAESAAAAAASEAGGAAALPGEGVASALEPALPPLARALRLATRMLGDTTFAVTAPSAEPAPDADADGDAAALAGVQGAKMLVGEAALRAAEMEPDAWEVVYPMRSGRLNAPVHSADAHPAQLSLRAVLSALLDIWRCAICGGGGEPGVGLTAAALPSACAVLALPDMQARRDTADMVSLLLEPTGLDFK